jgi:hypothetical protein
MVYDSFSSIAMVFNSFSHCLKLKQLLERQFAQAVLIHRESFDIA